MLRNEPLEPAAREGRAAPGRRAALPSWSRGRVAAAVLVAAAVAMALVALADHRAVTRLRDHGIFADGVVTEVDGGPSPAVVVEFEARDGRVVRARVATGRRDPAPKAGDAARVLYDPERPEDSARDGRLPAPDDAEALLRGAAAAVLLLTGLAAWHGRLPWLVEPLPDAPDQDGRSRR
jgi:hypothetical protein